RFAPMGPRRGRLGDRAGGVRALRGDRPLARGCATQRGAAAVPPRRGRPGLPGIRGAARANRGRAGGAPAAVRPVCPAPPPAGEGRGGGAGRGGTGWREGAVIAPPGDEAALRTEAPE